jgi:hypothetical protein
MTRCDLISQYRYRLIAYIKQISIRGGRVFSAVWSDFFISSRFITVVVGVLSAVRSDFFI